jgi:hypothetical protein
MSFLARLSFTTTAANTGRIRTGRNTDRSSPTVAGNSPEVAADNSREDNNRGTELPVARLAPALRQERRAVVAEVLLQKSRRRR